MGTVSAAMKKVAAISAIFMVFLMDRVRARLRVFAPQPERLLRGAIGEAEQHRVFRGVMRDRMPRGYDEDVAPTPGERAIADGARAAAFGDAKHRGIGGSIRL